MSKAKHIAVILGITAMAVIAGEVLKSKTGVEPAVYEVKLDERKSLVEPSPFEKSNMALGKTLEGPYPFFDQNGKSFELTDWLDKPLVISYIFTHCPMVCPTITQSLSDFAQSGVLTPGKDYRLVTVGFDPASDKPSAMKEFGSKFTSDFSNWRFVTSSPEIVKRLGDDIGVTYELDDKDSWRHTIGITVVGPGGLVSGQIFGMDLDVMELAEAISTAAESKTTRLMME